MTRTIIDDLKIKELNTLLGFEILSFKDELRGVNDTKYVLETNHTGSFKQCMLTIYEPKEISSGGRSFDETIKATKYGKHLYDSLKGIKDKDGELVEVGVPEPFLFGVDSKPYYEVEFNKIKKVISIHELIYDHKNELNNIHDYGEDSIDPDVSMKVGAALASVQLAGSDFNEKIENKYPIEGFKDMLDEIETRISDGDLTKIDPIKQNPIEVIKWIREKVNEILLQYEKIKGELEFGTCHLDCHPVNVIKGKNKIFFLDYGTVGIDSYIYDMTMGLDTFVCRGNKPVKNLVESFISGYDSVRKLPDIEVDNLLFFINAGLVKWTMYRVLKAFDTNESSNTFIARDNIERYENWEAFDSVNDLRKFM